MGKTRGRVPCEHSSLGQSPGLRCLDLPYHAGERGGYEVVLMLQLILGWGIDKCSLSYSLWAVMTDCVSPQILRLKFSSHRSDGLRWGPSGDA